MLSAAVAQPWEEGLEDALDKAGHGQCFEGDSEWEGFPGFSVLAKTRTLGCAVAVIEEILFFLLACESS